MAVAIGTVALAVDPLVFFCAQLRSVESMRRCEAITARKRKFHERFHAPLVEAAVQSTNRSGDSYRRTRSSFPALILGSSKFQITAAMFSHVGICPASSGTS